MTAAEDASTVELTLKLLANQRTAPKVQQHGCGDGDGEKENKAIRQVLVKHEQDALRSRGVTEHPDGYAKYLSDGLSVLLETFDTAHATATKVKRD